MLLARVSVEYNVDDVVIKGEYNQYNSLYDAIISLSASRAIVVSGNDFTYIDELRPDYKNLELYLPVYRYDEFEEGGVKVKYNNRLEKLVLHDRDGYRLNDLVVIPNIMLPEAYILNIGNLKLSRDLNDGDMQARDLFYRYITSSYGYDKNEIDVFDYTEVKKKYINKKQRELLKKYNLDFYGEYIDIDYRDVRNWDLKDLETRFTEKEIKLGESFNIRRLRFELELYTRLIDGLYWYGWTKGDIVNMINNNLDYVKYKEKDIYLIFKKRWLKN